MIPPKLPPRAPAIVEQVKAAETVLASLEAQTPVLALAKAELQPGAHKAYGDHLDAIAAARADVDAKASAAEAAAALDRAAAAERIALIRAADPYDLIEGVTTTDCCDGCSETECLLAGGLGICQHPNKAAIPPGLMSDPVIRKFREVARAELEAQVRGDYDDEDEDDNEEAV